MRFTLRKIVPVLISAAAVQASTVRFTPRRDRNCADMLSFADQVRNNAVFLPELEIFHFERHHLGPPQAASNQNSQNCPVTLTPEAVRRQLQQQSLGFV